jgi:hypothetical protein
MNREIKFRAYQEKLNRMWEWNELNHLPLRDLERKDLEWLQFTGLHDKNGKECFEGDIIEYKTIEPETFQECIHRVEIKEEFIGNLKSYGIPLAEQFEVIGNIYQNKDLIN